MCTYEETVSYLFSKLPMYQRVGVQAYKKDLTNIRLLLKALGNPEDKFVSIHIAGTNGKGTSSHTLSAILQSSGYKTGLYTSPHLKSFTERIRINGEEITKEFVITFTQKIKHLIEDIQPSFFEITVAMCFDYFAKEKVDIAVIETGLGGRLDSTNVVNPLVSLITNIGWDHQDLLGHTLQEIAFEKAGIIKPNVPVVIGTTQTETQPVFYKIAADMRSEIVFADAHYLIQKHSENSNGIEYQIFSPEFEFVIFTPLSGYYFQKNIAGILGVIAQLKKADFHISNSSIVKGFESVIEVTGIKGRWQKLQSTPLVIADVGHNWDGLQANLHQLHHIDDHKKHFVLGFVKDKSLDDILRLFPKRAHYYFTQASIPRALPTQDLVEMAKNFELKGNAFPNANLALAESLKHAENDHVIYIGGSTFVVAELDNL